MVIETLTTDLEPPETTTERAVTLQAVAMETGWVELTMTPVAWNTEQGILYRHTSPTLSKTTSRARSAAILCSQKHASAQLLPMKSDCHKTRHCFPKKQAMEKFNRTTSLFITLMNTAMLITSVFLIHSIYSISFLLIYNFNILHQNVTKNINWADS